MFDTRCARENGESLLDVFGGDSEPGTTRRGCPARNLGYGAEGGHAAPVEDQHVRADLLNLGQQMRAQQDGRTTLARDPADEREHLPLPGGIEPQRWLVEKDDSGLVDECPRDSEPLAHAAAVARDQRSAPVGESDVGQHLGRDRGRARPCVAVQPRVVSHELLSCLPLWVTSALRKNADPPADLERPRVRNSCHRERSL